MSDHWKSVKTFYRQSRYCPVLCVEESLRGIFKSFFFSEYHAVSLMTILLTMASLANGSPVYGETKMAHEVHVDQANVSIEALTPSDVLARVKRVQGELKLIRFEMGKPKVEGPHMAVTNVAPREVYFQALTLLEKADRLAFEYTKELGTTLTRTNPETIRPGHVWHVVDAALQRVLRVKETLSIRKSVNETPYQKEAVPTDVFHAIVETNRQLNVLLERQFAPRDVFRQVTLSIHYAAKLLAHFPKAKRLPDARPFEHGKTTENVYERLVECFGQVGAIAKLSGLTILQFNRTQTKIQVIRPSDVYDMASLIVADLAYVHSQLSGARAPNQVYDFGRKFPSHVYQRAGILLDQLLQLEQHVQTIPQWLQG